jgi:hypothetical protein
MQKIDTMSLPVPAPVKDDWEFAEVWMDAMLFPPYVLLLLGDRAGHCRVYNPAEGYKVIFISSTYEEAQLWLLEDEYEPIEGRVVASDLELNTVN